ncbi:hypothetical protein EDI_278290 [Entamoeba dispar SAW760]|uniref:Uncharacterized protein n=1 Tax=Entamoeba dispar (strain ATCC PRA-260 / SAW760) TaxID=370354 RepID=B0ECW6_ENTDS|nr:uncharacterized protein EDI_278290 [Entamoeba dispar SAW760]EDR27658.1 hypothetical protein EDI_278290 [Entamoeba dispar SAW760]|eukprot:EDR27658.1 hypothetical protein EDI_278290 [Entamoeba dispar SAW760]
MLSLNSHGDTSKETQEVKENKEVKELKEGCVCEVQTMPVQKGIELSLIKLLTSELSKPETNKKDVPDFSDDCHIVKGFNQKEETNLIKKQKEKKPKKTKTSSTLKKLKEKEVIEQSIKIERTCSQRLIENSETSDISDSIKSQTFKNTLALTHKNLCNQGKESSVRIKERDRRIVQWMDEALQSKTLLPYPNPLTPLVRL